MGCIAIGNAVIMGANNSRALSQSESATAGLGVRGALVIGVLLSSNVAGIATSGAVTLFGFPGSPRSRRCPRDLPAGLAGDVDGSHDGAARGVRREERLLGSTRDQGTGSR